jgi:hypothetical protein
MPGRGSGIGLGMIGGLGANQVGGSKTSTRSGTPRIYGSRFAGTSSGGFQVHHYLWALVAIEMLALIWLRHAFRRYHGG